MGMRLVDLYPLVNLPLKLIYTAGSPCLHWANVMDFAQAIKENLKTFFLSPASVKSFCI